MYYLGVTNSRLGFFNWGGIKDSSMSVPNKRAQRTEIILERTRRIPSSLSLSAERRRGTGNHNERELCSIGIEEDPVRRACAHIERKARAIKRNGNSSHPLCIYLFPPSLPPSSTFLDRRPMISHPHSYKIELCSYLAPILG